ncbi:hypothetical protein GA0115240_105821 [Streptomyces sp. DvalAA-14]|nr:hypothetical protein GA0115240_105821 [Streptomyces sp. DvalAA-14]
MERLPSGQFVQRVGETLERVVSRGEPIMITRYGRDYVMISPPPRDDTPPDGKPTE